MKRGISPLIASVLLIAFVIALFVVVSMFVSRTSEEAIEGTEGQFESVIGSINAKVEVDDMVVEGGEVRLKLENTGDKDFDKVKVKIIGINGVVSEQVEVDLTVLDIKNVEVSYDEDEVGVVTKVEIYPMVGDRVYAGGSVEIEEREEEVVRQEAITGSSCLDIYNKNNEAQDGMYTITPGDESVEVYCDMEDGGWTLVWHGYPTHARYDITSLEEVALGNDITFNEVRIDGVNIDHSYTDRTSETAVLKKTIREYYMDVAAEPNSRGCDRTPPGVTCPHVKFHDVDGNKDVTMNRNRFLMGYGNVWRIFWECVNVAAREYMWLGWCPNPTRSSFDSASVGCTSSGDNYCQNSISDARTDTKLGITKKEWQETKVYVR